MTPKCKYCYDKKYYSVWKGIHGSPDFIGDKAIGELPDKHMIPCPKCNKPKSNSNFSDFFHNATEEANAEQRKMMREALDDKE